ncbi:MAG: transcription termination factor NusA [Pyrinomonadaceae bacterium MAG19_C2-C3]|nr:transcription termination factor NusA [Pyrinomonadaceae bacterium MAG19_C2-C3]
MSASIGQSIDLLCKEKGIDRELVIEAMKDAVRAAAKKQFRSGEEIYVEWSSESGIELFSSKVIVEEVTNPAIELSIDEAREMAGDEVEIGDELQLPLPMEEMGRIAAQTAKQILFQKVRDAERANIYDQYIDKMGDLVSGFVKRFERGDVIIDLGTIEVVLPRKEQSRGEQWSQGERVRVVISEVQKEAKGLQVEVSRTSPELVRRLFEMEVPEIYDETVTIKNAVREPGERAKIAVTSNERDVDPVGACVGMKGSRVQAIIRELRGEKIDIIEWSDEPSVFAANALSPAKVNQVRITDIEKRQMEVIVNDDQLSLAIGKRGQNVRLATKLVGWNIDIRSEEEVKKQVAASLGALIASGEAVPLTALEGVSPAVAATLAEHNIETVDALAATSVDDLVDMLDTSLDEAQAILDSVQAIVASRTVEENGGDANQAQATEQEATSEATPEETTTITEQHAASIEMDDNKNQPGVEPSNESTNEGYDEAVRGGTPFQAEADILAQHSADPVALTEAEAISADELALQGAGRDLQPDTIMPAPDITSSEAAMAEDAEDTNRTNELSSANETEEDAPFSPSSGFASEASMGDGSIERGSPTGDVVITEDDRAEGDA